MNILLPKRITYKKQIHKNAKSHSLDPSTGAHFSYQDIVNKLLRLKSIKQSIKNKVYNEHLPRNLNKAISCFNVPLMVESKNDILYVKKIRNLSRALETHKYTDTFITVNRKQPYPTSYTSKKCYGRVRLNRIIYTKCGFDISSDTLAKGYKRNKLNEFLSGYLTNTTYYR